MKKIISIITASICIVSLLCGCQKAPDKQAVTSKNDGVFLDRINETLPKTDAVREDNDTNVQWVEEFKSTDGSVDFVIDINDGITEDVKSVIEVVPHYLSSDDIRRVAEALLEDTIFYERRPSEDPEYSKAQYQQMINRMAPYTNRETLVALMGENGADTYQGYIQKIIAVWTTELETAAENDPRKVCDWTLKKERHYNNSEIEIGNRSVEDESDVLYANAEKDGIEYNFSAITKSSNGYKINRLNLNLSEGLGLYPVDMAIYRSKLCRTDTPTKEQIDDSVAKVESMLEQMQLGQWDIYSAEVKSKVISNSTEYTIHIVAIPNLNGNAVIFGQNVANYQEAYAASYSMTYAEFMLSANGDLVYFNLESPMDIVETRNENVTTLSATDLLETCKQQLSFRDAGTFGLPSETVEELEKAKGEKIRCKVKLSDAEYGMGRVMVVENDDHYYYIPVLVLRGIVEYIGETSNRCYYTNYHDGEEKMPSLIWINAVDGSIIS